MLELWKKQFTIERLHLKHDNPAVFVTSQWQRDPAPNKYYLVYRWLIAVFFMISLVLSVLDLRHLDQPAINRVKWLIYLTSWGFATCTIQTTIAAFMLTIAFVRKLDPDGPAAVQDNNTLKLYKIYWVANITATDIAYGITIIYWLLIYDESKMALDEMNIIVHVVNSIVMLVDLFVVAHPVRIMHFYWPVIYGMCYVLFSIIYYLSGGTSKEGSVFIYPILDWSKPGMTLMVCILVTLFIVILHCITFGMYRLRKLLYKKLASKQNAKTEVSEKSYNNPVLSVDLV